MNCYSLSALPGKIIDHGNKRLIEGRCAATLGGKSHHYHGSESAKKNSRGERKFSSEPEVSLHSALAWLSSALLKGFEKKNILSIHE